MCYVWLYCVLSLLVLLFRYLLCLFTLGVFFVFGFEVGLFDVNFGCLLFVFSLVCCYRLCIVVGLGGFGCCGMLLAALELFVCCVAFALVSCSWFVVLICCLLIDCCFDVAFLGFVVYGVLFC